MGRRDAWLETARAAFNLASGGPPALRDGAGLVAGALVARGGGAASALQARLLENSDLLIFNSPLEAQAVHRCFPATRRQPVAEAPVGVDVDALSAPDPRPFLRRYRLKPGFALSVGRIEDLKNQLALIRALGDLPIPLVLIGPVNPHHRAYARRVVRAAAARPGTLVIHHVERGMLLSAMAAAAVHVLPSWFETAGLTSLEAAVAGCAVVSTDRGYARAFLGDDAAYCDPSDEASIRRAVLLSLERGPSPRLRGRILERFTERRAAAATAELYARVV
jgi:glycosyltransferase involved in cell wall biosynthesis